MTQLGYKRRKQLTRQLSYDPNPSSAQPQEIDAIAANGRAPDEGARIVNELVQLGERITIERVMDARYGTPTSEAAKLPEHLREAVAKQALQRYSERTLQSYDAHLFEYQMFCAPYAIKPFPLDGQVVSAFLTQFAGKWSYWSIEGMVAALACAQRILGFPSIWTDGCVRDTLAGIRNEHGCARNPQLPIMQDMLADIIEAALKDPLRIRGLRKALICGFGFEVAARGGELAAAKRSHVVRREKGYTFHFPSSKTDRGGEGYTVAIAPSFDPRYCVVALLDEFLPLLPEGDGPLYPHVDQYGNVADEHVCGKRITQLVKEGIVEAGHDPTRRSAHSLRSGNISQATMDGQKDDEICKTSRHKNKEIMWRYQRLDPDAIIQRKITERLGYARRAA